MKTQSNQRSLVLIFLLLFFIVFVLHSCGSRKVKKEEQKEEQKIEIQTTDKKLKSTETNLEEVLEMKKETRDTEFVIKPVRDTVVNFKINYKGEELTGTSNGEILIRELKTKVDSSEKTKTDTKTEIKEVIVEKVKWKDRHIYTEKEVEKAEGWIFWAILIGFGILLAEKLSKYIKKIS